MDFNPVSHHNRSGFKSSLLMTALLTGLGLLLYANTIRAPFVFDDTVLLYEPRLSWTELSIDNLTGLTRITTENVAPRVVSNLTFALNYYFGGHNVIGYHLFNMAVHIITAFLIFLIARRIMPPGRGYSPLAPAAAALLWLVHPLHIESVTYIWQRMNALMTMFYLLSFYLYIRARQRQRFAADENKSAGLLFIGCATAGLLALGAKQTAVTLPLLLVAGELFFFQNLEAGRVRKQLIWAVLLTGGAIALLLFYQGTSPLATLRAPYENQAFTMGERLLTQPRVILFYLTLLFWPHPTRFNLDYDFPLSTGLLSPADTLTALVALVALIFAIVYLAGKHRLPAFALLWFLVTLIPESSIVGLELVFGYRTYLPSTFIVIALAGLLPDHRRQVLNDAVGRKTLSGRHVTAGRIALAGIVLAVVVGSVWTVQRNTAWRSEIALWQDTIDKSPKKCRPRHNLGIAYLARNQPEKARPFLSQAVALNPNSLLNRHSLALALAETGEIDQAISLFKQIIAVRPRAAQIHYELARLYLGKNRLEEAIDHYRRAIDSDPRHARAYNNLGGVLLMQGRFQEATTLFNRAVEIAPGFQAPYINLAAVYKETSPRTALAHLTAARAINPEDREVLLMTAEILERLGETDRAIRFYEEAATLINTEPQQP